MTIAIALFDPRKPFVSGALLVRDAFVRLNDLIKRTGGERGEAFGPLPVYTVATLPSAQTDEFTSNDKCLIFVSDESGGPTPAFSDGTNWRRFTDLAIVS